MDDLMKEAWSLTNGDRRDAYGDPREVFAAYGDVWSAILRTKLKPGERVTASDVTLMMVGLKICRESVNAKRDNVVDAHGYLSLHTRVIAPRDPEAVLREQIRILHEIGAPQVVLDVADRALYELVSKREAESIECTCGGNDDGLHSKSCAKRAWEFR